MVNADVGQVSVTDPLRFGYAARQDGLAAVPEACGWLGKYSDLWQQVSNEVSTRYRSSLMLPINGKNIPALVVVAGVALLEARPTMVTHGASYGVGRDSAPVILER